MVKTKIFFIHGWGFDHDFWRPLIYELKKLKLDMQFSFYLFNLGFLDNEEKLKLSHDSEKKLFIVHSYGFNWLIEEKIKCDLIVNFFGLPIFVEKNNDYLKNIYFLNNMIKGFKKNPIEVLKKFYINCGLSSNFYKIEKVINKEKMLHVLTKLKYLNQIESLKNQSADILSLISMTDKIARFRETKNYFFNKNHKFKILKNANHAFPYTHPKKASKIIECFLKKNI